MAIRLDRMSFKGWFMAVCLGVVSCLIAGQSANGQAISDRAASLPWPRLASGQIGNWGSIDSERVRNITNSQIAVLGLWRGWSVDGYNMGNFASYLKSLNPDLIVLQYINFVELDPGQSEWNFVKAKIEREQSLKGNRSDWWLHRGDGSIPSGFKSTWKLINFTNWVTRDSNGFTYPEWYANYYYASATDAGDWVRSGYGIRDDAWDGVFADVQQISYPNTANADWDDDLVNEDRWDADLRGAIVDGLEASRNEWVRLKPDILYFGNTSAVLHPSETIPEKYKQIFDGAWLEMVASYETWGTWAGMMTAYRKGMDLVKGPRIAMFNAILSQHRDYYASRGLVYSDYRWNRYLMASAFMDDGWYMVSDNLNFDKQLWFDEFNLKMGRNIDGPQFSPWSNGVYRREFDNALVLVNPKGNGSQTVNVGPGWKRFLGTQDPIHNNGESVTTITLSDQDGIILIRDGAIAKPAVPVELRVE